MRFLVLIFIFIKLFANPLQICYVSEDYKSFDKIFGHLFMALDDKAASFNLASDMNIKDNLQALFGTKALMQILNKDKLIRFYEKQGRTINCYDTNLSETQISNISILFMQDDIDDTYTFLRKNCSSALADYAKDYDINFQKSLLPEKFTYLNANYKRTFSSIGGFYDSDTKSVDFSFSLLELNHFYNHFLSIFTLSKNQFSLIKMAEYNGLSFDFDLGYKFIQNRFYANGFLGYELFGFFAGVDSKGLTGGYVFDIKSFGFKINAYKDDFKLLLELRHKNTRLNLIANKKSAKIGIIFAF